MLILQGRGISPQPFFESVVFMDGVACGDAVFSAIEMNLSSEQNNNNRNIGTGWQSDVTAGRFSFCVTSAKRDA